MGFFRLLLALNVLLYHIPNLNNSLILNPFTSVSIFFIISGFYMALILNEKYYKQKKANFLFYTNRFLRIYPTYLIVLTLFIALSIIKYVFHIGSSTDNAIYHFILYAPQTSPIKFFLYSLNFVFRNITLVITSDYFWNSSKTAGFFLVQQAWTLQLEVLFYLVSPFIARKKPKQLLVFTLIYFLCRYIFLKTDLLSYESLFSQFFSYFVFFLMGIWSYWLYIKIKRWQILKKYIIQIVVVALTFAYYFPIFAKLLNSGFKSPKEIFFYVIISIFLPVLFIYSKNNKLDTYLGEYSYPIYILHFLFIKLINNIPYFEGKIELSVFIILFLTFTMSAILIKYLDKPLYNYRQLRVKKAEKK